MARYWSWTATLLCIIITMEATVATQLKVGGNQGWAPPSGSEKETYNQWAQRYRFLINDALVFTYNPSVDSVLVVNKQDYDTCTTSNPIKSYKDGNTIFQFPKHGPFYFISGNATNCQKGEKLVIVVLSPRTPSGKSNVSPAPAPSTVATPPSVVPVASPSVAPVLSPTVASPSVAPGVSPTVASPSVAPMLSPTVAPPIVPTVAPTVAPTIAPTVAPTVAPIVASVPSVAAVPAMAPENLAPQTASPTPAPMGSEGRVVPSSSAGKSIIHPWFVSASLAVLGFLGFFSGILT